MTKEYQMELLIESCFKAEQGSYDFFVIIKDLVNDIPDYMGIVTLIKPQGNGAWFQDQMTGQRIFLSQLFHDHQAVDWKTLKDAHEASQVKGIITLWHNQWIPVDKDLHESLWGVETLRAYH